MGIWFSSSTAQLGWEVSIFSGSPALVALGRTQLCFDVGRVRQSWCHVLCNFLHFYSIPFPLHCSNTGMLEHSFSSTTPANFPLGQTLCQWLLVKGCEKGQASTSSGFSCGSAVPQMATGLPLAPCHSPAGVDQVSKLTKLAGPCLSLFSGELTLWKFL